MSSTLDRLRRLHDLRPQSEESEPTLPDRAPAAPPARGARTLAALVPGEEIETEQGRCYVVTERYPLETERGQCLMHEIFERSAAAIAPLYPSAGLDDLDFGRVAFIDTETTGLGGGAGIYPFMVGIGTFEGRDAPRGHPAMTHRGDESSPVTCPLPPATHFVVRQYFMRHPGEELALLTAVADLLADRAGLVTFNGRTFDAPLLRGRYHLNRRMLRVDGPDVILDEDAPHLDLLHPARRLWKQSLESCRLSALEEAILAHRRSEADVPGHLIPMLYAQYLRDGDARSMRRVFYHNVEDIVSMVFLAERICRHFADPLAEADDACDGRTLLALGQVHEQMGALDRAERAFRHALERLRGEDAADAFDRLGRLLKRQERWDEACDLWQQWITSVPGPDPRPYEELAKYCEWQGDDLEQAEMWTAWALHNQQAAPSWQRSRRAIQALTHRLERIRGKLARHTSET